MLFLLVILLAVAAAAALVSIAILNWGVAWGMVVLAGILLAVAAGWGTFITKELVKKFGFMKGLVEGTSHEYMYRWKYSGNLKPGMYTLRLSTRDVPAPVMWNVTGFVDLDLPGGMPGMDPFFSVSKRGPIYVRTWLGSGEVRFVFVANRTPVRVVVIDDVDTKPDFEASPHWWQRLGFYG